MATIPPSFLANMISDVPERCFEQVLKTLKINEKHIFKEFVSTKATSKYIYKDFVFNLFSCDLIQVQALYTSIEGVLFVGGCAPGFGIAFNLVDACFCFILGNWLGCFVAVVSCFPIPGFKIAGKGIEKFIMNILKRISPNDLMKFINKVGRRLEAVGYHSTEAYMAIRKQIEEIIPNLNNPFAEFIITEFYKIIKRFPTSQKAISESVCKTGKELYSNYSIKPKKLLEFTTIKTSHL